MEYYKNLDLADIKYFCEFDLVWKIEQWKDIIEYECIYMVSDLGRVKSLSRLKRKNKFSKYFLTKERILNSRKTRLGYLMVVLYLDSIKENFSVHRLVALSFIPNPENKLEVNHKNENKTHNFRKNLEWSTRTENIRHSMSVKVFQYTLELKLIKEWSNLTDTRNEGFNPCNIVDTCKGRQKQHKGFIWSYIILN